MDIKEIQIRLPMTWLDDEWSVDLHCHYLNAQDTGGRDEIWCYFHDVLLCTFTDLEKFLTWFQLTTEKTYNEAKEQQKKNVK